ncbi:MAG: 3-deoxy-7-phosphoheptulonate synthase [Fidelibacterota bacterium]
MLVIMHNTATDREVRQVMEKIESLGLQALSMPGSTRTTVGVIGNRGYIDEDRLLHLPGVKEIIHITKPYKRVSREFKTENTLVNVGDQVTIGKDRPVIIAGPCAVESYDQLQRAARGLDAAGVHMLRGGAYKPRSSPYSFQGLKEEGLRILRQVGDECRLPVVSEILSIADLDQFARLVDMVQIGARNMQNFDLLQHVATLNKPVLLKRGLSATMEEFLLAAEYILNQGNDQVVLCERGIRTFETSTRNILDLNTLALIKQESHLPIIADPSHAAGRSDLILPLSKAALAAGADGLIVEVHPQPAEALSDGRQSLTLDQFSQLLAGMMPA